MVAMQATSTGVACSAVCFRSRLTAIVCVLRDIAWAAVYGMGALSLYHRLRNRNALTVALFHRVLKRDDPRWETALHEWTLTDNIFDECLAFFKRHYTLVTLDDVKAALKGVRRLPQEVSSSPSTTDFPTTAIMLCPCSESMGLPPPCSSPRRSSDGTSGFGPKICFGPSQPGGFINGISPASTGY
jgi:hypothetical protein